MNGHRIPQIRRATLLVLVLLIGMTLATPDRSMAQVCQTPLFLLQNTQGANIMILADNSSSMNTVIFHSAYDHEQAYAGPFETLSLYFVATCGDRTPQSFDATWDTEPTAYLVDSDNGQKGQYPGNYLNWIYYHATQDQIDDLPRATRIQASKLILCDLIDSFPNLRFGLTVFQSDHFGSIIGKCGSNPVSLKAQINGITANTWTPIGESMETILDYFSDDNPGAPIEEPCQVNFLIVLCDGLPTMDTEVSLYLHDADNDGNDPGSCASIGAPYYNESYHCSDHMDDVAYYMANEDLRADMEDDQTVSTYTIGFHVDSPLLEETAVNGNGLYFTARNAVELRNSLEWVIQDIIRRISAGSAVAVISTERGLGDRIFRGKFMPVSWEGYLEAFTIPYNDGDSPVWEAGDLLRDRDPDDRTIFTALGLNLYNFTAGQAANLHVAMDIPIQEDAAEIIAWTRGDNLDGLRNRGDWVLGDIIHSTPVVVGAPTHFWPEESYMEYYANNVDRQVMVYVGSNDGMLHAFNSDTGREEWAFIPEFALPKLEAVADTNYCHLYTCDQTVTVDDLRYGLTWRTILVGGGREGGAGYFAFDVTDPYAPTLLWQITLPNGVAFASQPTFATINGQAIVLIGSGLDDANGDAFLYAYDVITGTYLGGLHLSHSNNARNKATRPAVVDMEYDGETDVFYVGDLLGSIWRIDPAHSTNPGFWNVTEFYAGTQPITAEPTVAYGPDGSLFVYFGTGAYVDEDDMDDLSQQSFYCVNDWYDGVTYGRSDLADQTNSLNDIGNDEGWYIDLWHEAGERITEAPLVVARTVAFTSYAPTQAACVSGGRSYLYQMHYQTGGLPEDEDGEPGDLIDRATSLGDGLASRPVIDLTNGTLVIQSSDASIDIEEVGIDFFRLVVRSWQESYDFMAEAIPEN